MGQRLANLPEVNNLTKKIIYTLGFLAIYRVGVHLPIPGVDTQALSQFFSSQGANMFGMFNMFSGGALERFSVFELGVMPYISASIIAQLLTVVVPHLEQLSKEGESGRKKITQYTRYGTVLIAVVQGYMIASGLEGSQQMSGMRLVMEGGASWKWMTVLSLTAGSAFVMWLGEQITERGVGNGISLIIFAGIVAGLPSVISNTYSQTASGDMDFGRALLIAVVCMAICAGVVFMEQAERKIPVTYAKRQVGRRVFGGQSSFLPMRINASGVIPPIFASSLLNFPVTFAAMSEGSAISNFITSVFIPGGWLYNAVFAPMVIFFAFFYTSIVFKPDDIAEDLKKSGGFIPGIRPGAKTADYLHKISHRLVCPGSLYLAGICVVPTVLIGKFDVQFYFGGTSLLIVVGVALQTFRDIDSQMQQLRYESFMSKGNSGRGSSRGRGQRRGF